MMRRVVTSLIAFAAIILAGVLYTQNSEFSIDYALESQDGGVTSRSGTNTLSMAYVFPAGVSPDAAGVFSDINSFVPNAAISISKLLTESDTLQTEALFRGSGFDIEPGDGLLVQVSQDTPYVLRGMHDPTASIRLTGVEDGSNSGTHLFAPPYGTTSETASDLRDEIDDAAGEPAVLSISRLIRASDTFETYSGTNPANDFTLVPGKAYIVQVARTVEFFPEVE